MGICLVTGAAGFIGSNLVRRLLADGHQVVAVDNFTTGSRANLEGLEYLDGKFQLKQVDIRHRETLQSVMQGVEFVFHEAAIPSVMRSIADPWSSNDANINGTLSVLLAARDAGVRRLVYAASSSAYGDTEVLPKVETMPAKPLSPYAVTKYVGELYCQVFANVYGLQAVALRYSNVFGPRQNRDAQYASAIPKFISSLIKGERPTVFGDGNQTRDFTYIDNVLDANIGAAMAPGEAVAGRVFNVGCGERVTVNSLIDEIQKILGTSIKPDYVDPRPGEIRDSQVDISAARQAFGYQPAIDFREGLRRTVPWFTGGQKAGA